MFKNKLNPINHEQMNFCDIIGTFPDFRNEMFVFLLKLISIFNQIAIQTQFSKGSSVVSLSVLLIFSVGVKFQYKLNLIKTKIHFSYRLKSQFKFSNNSNVVSLSVLLIFALGIKISN